MLWPWHLRRAAWLLSLCLLTQCHLHTAGSLASGDALPKAPAGDVQVPGAESREASEDDLFPDVDPKDLAAVLLQALRTEPALKADRRQRDPEASADEERVRSRTLSADAEPGWEEERPGGRGSEEEPQQQQQQQDRSAAWREGPTQERRAAALPEEDEGARLRRANPRRKASPSEPWEGARKLRQQQHLEHQLLQRRYEELAESRRQAEEARRAAAEEERLADMASDLLLQYLLKDGEEGEGEAEGEGRRGAQESPGEGGRGSSLLFEDEEGNVAEDKRSNEAPEGGEAGDGDGDEGGEDDIDPGTIDRLIELSSKLHLPADDVIDIINDVERKKDVPEPSKKSKALAAPARPAPRPAPKQRRPKQDEAAWNEVLRGDEHPAPKWRPARPDRRLSNYISPRTFQPPGYRRFRRPPAAQEDDDDRARDEELQNYVERVLMGRPPAFP